jgi:hypothetical protein
MSNWPTPLHISAAASTLFARQASGSLSGRALTRDFVFHWVQHAQQLPGDFDASVPPKLSLERNSCRKYSNATKMLYAGQYRSRTKCRHRLGCTRLKEEHHRCALKSFVHLPYCVCSNISSMRSHRRQTGLHPKRLFTCRACRGAELRSLNIQRNKLLQW